MSDLIVIGYPDEQTASRVWQELVKLQKDYLVDLDMKALHGDDQAAPTWEQPQSPARA